MYGLNAEVEGEEEEEEKVNEVMFFGKRRICCFQQLNKDRGGFWFACQRP